MYQLFINNRFFATYSTLKEAIRDANYYYNSGNDTEIIER